MHFFIMIFISLNIFVYYYSPRLSVLSLFLAFRRCLIVYLVPLCRLRISEMLFSTFSDEAIRCRFISVEDAASLPR